VEDTEIMVTVEQQRKTWTRDEAARLSELFPDERLELIEGDLITKMGQKPAHAFVVALLTQLLVAAFRERVRTQLAIDIADPKSEPEPDVVVLHRSIREFVNRHPGPADIELLIEVADTSLELDRTIKHRLYARAGVQEYWIIDIANRRAIVSRRPDRQEYRSVLICEGGDELSIGGFRCTVADILPPS
jgi:Uma2 family endonuclease